jgi:hypothetical protein
VISPNTAIPAAEAIRRGHKGLGHDEGDACVELATRLDSEAQAARDSRLLIEVMNDPEAGSDAAVRFATNHDAPPAGPGGTPKITIGITTEIAGEWVEPEMISYAARQLVAALSARLGGQADEAARGGM